MRTLARLLAWLPSGLLARSLGAGCAALLAVAAAWPASAAEAEPVEGPYFAKDDWEVACDNTLTCRAAGYQPDAGDAPPLSILLTRKAGAGTPVEGSLRIGELEDEAAAKRLPDPIPARLRIDGRDLGTVAVRKDELLGQLAPAQVAALLAALTRATTIEVAVGTERLRLSDRGAAAVLLKMDDVQGRIGTPGALARKGSRAEASVPPPRPMPVIVPPVIAPALSSDDPLVKRQAAALRKALLATVSKEDCPLLADAKDADLAFDVARLSAAKLVVSTPCWSAAYNEGSGFWVVDAGPPWRPALVTTVGNDIDAVTISSSQKGRGLGDCWSLRTWTWDGRRFVPSSVATTGLCRMVGAGGPWLLSTLVTDIRPAGK